MSSYAVPQPPPQSLRDRILTNFRPFAVRVGQKSDMDAFPERHDPEAPDPRKLDFAPSGLVQRATLPAEVFARPDLGPVDRLPPLSFPKLDKDDPRSAAAEPDDGMYSWKSRPDHTEWMRREWNSLWKQPEITLDQLSPWRVRAAWRLVREMARARGLIQPDEMLIELEGAVGLAPQQPEWDGAPSATALMYDPWVTPDQHVTAHTPNQKTVARGNEGYLYARTHYLIQDCELRLNGKDEYRPYQWTLKAATDDSPQTWQPMHFKGLPLLPPPIPLPWIDAEHPDRPKDGYDASNPSHDPALHAYIEIMRGIVQLFYIDLGTELDQNSGRYGLAGLLDPELVRLAFPSRFQIMTYEAMLVEETLNLVIKGGKTYAREQLAKLYGLQPVEILQLIRIASVKALELTSEDVEEGRSLMILQLEAAAQRARSALDIRAEIAALKNIAIVKGLARVEPESMVKDFIDVVRAASGGARRVESVSSPALPHLDASGD